MATTFSKDSNPVKNYIAFFDLDQTITSSISGKELARGAFRKGLMTRYDLTNAIFLSLLFRLELKDPLKIIDKMVRWVEGISEKTIVDLCSEVFREVLLPSVYDEARSEIEFHKGENAKVVILSSALAPVCNDMAKDLGFDDVICSDLEVKNGYHTGRPLGHVCFGEEKAIRLKDYCEKNSILPSDSWYYGDSISDLSALSVVGHPVCVNPDKKLRKMAIKKNWRILYWKS